MRIDQARNDPSVLKVLDLGRGKLCEYFFAGIDGYDPAALDRNRSFIDRLGGNGKDPTCGIDLYQLVGHQ